MLDKLRAANSDQAAGIRIVWRAMEEPLRQIVSNAGAEPSVILARVVAGEAISATTPPTKNSCDMVAMGVLDPCKRSRGALQNAASMAGLILSTDCPVADLPARNESGSGEGGRWMKRREATGTRPRASRRAGTTATNIGNLASHAVKNHPASDKAAGEANAPLPRGVRNDNFDFAKAYH